jgi:hypothetical protein
VKNIPVSILQGKVTNFSEGILDDETLEDFNRESVMRKKYGQVYML